MARIVFAERPNTACRVVASLMAGLALFCVHAADVAFTGGEGGSGRDL